MSDQKMTLESVLLDLNNLGYKVSMLQLETVPTVVWFASLMGTSHMKGTGKSDTLLGALAAALVDTTKARNLQRIPAREVPIIAPFHTKRKVTLDEL